MDQERKTDTAQLLSEVARAGHEEDFMASVETTREEEEQFRALLPKDGFLHYYMKYTDRQESPDSYHFWVAATIIGGVIQRRAWLDRGVYSIYPSLYTVLVGPSGVTRKSRAMRLGTDLLDGFEWANVVADKTTPEALLEAMQFGSANVNADMDEGTVKISTDASAFIRASELAVFLNKQSYTSGMVALLTDLYDSPRTFDYRTRNKKPITLRNVSVSFLGASTPEWLATNLPEAAFEGGFMSRVILVVRRNRSRFIAFPAPPEPGQKEALQGALKHIRSNFRGSIVLDESAQGWFSNWYVRHETQNRESDYNLLGFVERKPDTVFKVALILAASEAPERHTITRENLETAEKIVTWTQRWMFRAFENVEMSHLGDLRRKVTQMIEANGGEVTRRDIMRKLGGRIRSVSDFDEIEKLMQGAGEMVVEHKPHKGQGRPKIVYRLPTREEGEDS